MKLCEFVVSGAIIPELKVASKAEAIKAMVASLRTAGSIIEEKDEKGIVDAIMKREDLGSTGIGRGVAVPHTKHPSVSTLIAAIALVPEGVEFDSLDGEPVYIMFLLVSPPNQPGDHLRGLENISRHLRNDNFCNFLRQSKTSEAVWGLLKEADANEI